MISALAIASSTLAILSDDDEDDLMRALERSILTDDFTIFGRELATTPLPEVYAIFRSLARWANESHDLDEFAGRARILFSAWNKTDTVYQGVEGDRFRASSEGIGPRIPNAFFEPYIELDNAIKKAQNRSFKLHKSWIPGNESVRLTEFCGSMPYISYFLGGVSKLQSDMSTKILVRELQRAKEIGGFALRGTIEVYEVDGGLEVISWDEERILFFKNLLTSPVIEIRRRSEIATGIKVTT